MPAGVLIPSFISLVAPGRQGRVDAAGKKVRARSLDSILAGKKCTYIKYDVEGADLEALKGSEYTISRYAPKNMQCVVSQTI